MPIHCISTYNSIALTYQYIQFLFVSGTSASFRRVYEDPIVAARQPGARSQEISLGEDRGAELSRMTQMFVLRRTQEINNKYLPPKSMYYLSHFSYLLTLSQTTNFRLFQTERVSRRQFQI